MTWVLIKTGPKLLVTTWYYDMGLPMSRHNASSYYLVLVSNDMFLIRCRPNVSSYLPGTSLVWHGSSSGLDLILVHYYLVLVLYDMGPHQV